MPKRSRKPRKIGDTYYFDEYIGFGSRKRRVRFSLRTDRPDEAQFKYDQEYERLWLEYYGVEPETFELIRFNSLLQEYVSYLRDIKKNRRWRDYELVLDSVSKMWRNPYLHEVKERHIKEYDRHLKGKVKESTINRYLAYLKAFFNYAVKRKKLRTNPVKDFKFYIEDEEILAYSDREKEMIFEAAKKIQQSRRTRYLKYAHDFMVLAYNTGMRLSEILNLRWSNIREDVISLQPSGTKSKRKREIPINTTVRELLERLRKEKRSDYVFNLGRTRAPSRVHALGQRISEMTDIDFKMHVWRHTAATDMLKRGVDVRTVQEILGHSKIETTMRYLSSDLERKRKAVEKLGEK